MPRAAFLLACAASLVGLLTGCAERVELPGLLDPVRVFTDGLGVPHIVAANDLDLFRVQGYVQARDRFSQMDRRRRAASGTSAELTGRFSDLTLDVSARAVGIRRAAEQSLALLSPRERDILEAYAAGVNAWLVANPLPLDYEQVEVTAVPTWEALDSLAILKLDDFIGVDYDFFDTGLLESYVSALGAEVGEALYFEDLGRQAPLDPAATVPDAGGVLPFLAQTGGPVAAPTSLAGIESDPGPWSAASPFWRLRAGVHGRAHGQRRGSQAWAVAAWASETGGPLVATDGHVELNLPSVWYENHLIATRDPRAGKADAHGITVLGVPGIGHAGQNRHVAWGYTLVQVDDADFFRDTLVRDDPSCPVRLCIVSEGVLHPVEERTESYWLNLPDDGVLDNLVDVTAIVRGLQPTAVDVLTVPFRSDGWIYAVDDPTVLSGGPATQTQVTTFQSTNLHGDRFLRSRLSRLRARDVHEFGESVRLAPKGGWVVADVTDNVAFFTSGKAPLRVDLEAGVVVGRPPFLVRDGSGPNNWVPDPTAIPNEVPFQLLPFEELPHLVNPPAGFVVNANEDPSGLALDNDLVNQFRRSKPGAIYYYAAYFGVGWRSARATAALRERIEAGERLGVEDLMRLQTETRARDAEVMRPFLLTAFANARRAGAPPELSALASDPAVVEAVERLADWDLTSPTGIPEGYDASDEDGQRDPEVGPDEAEASVAATLYNVWRATLIEDVVGGRLRTLGLQHWQTYGYAGLLKLLREEPFSGAGASGIDFFPEPAALAPVDRRDLALLQALRETLDDLASSRYEAAFAGSTELGDYRWGKLSRLTFDHILSGAFSIPPAAGFDDLGPRLPGIPRDGAYNALNTTGFQPVCYIDFRFFFQCRGAVNRFQSFWGAGWRRVMAPGHREARGAGVVGWSSLPGGASGDPESPLYASRLPRWLTGDYDRVIVRRSDLWHEARRTEHFVPVRAGTPE